MNTMPQPGLDAQERYRTLFRVLGGAVLGTGLVLTVVAFLDLFSGFGSDAMEMPTRFPLAFVGLPLVAVGSWLLRAGFLGAAARYTAGETMPVVKDSASYLTDGEGLLGVGRATGDRSATGPYCRSCGVRNDDDARFCDSCGHSLA